MTVPPALLPGRLARLTVLDLGLFEVRGGERLIGIPAYLLETDRGDRILFDTGFPPEYLTDPTRADKDGLPRFGRLVDFRPDQTAPGALAALGLSPRDITLTILSHGHIDHVSVWSRRSSSPSPPTDSAAPLTAPSIPFASITFQSTCSDPTLIGWTMAAL